MYSLLRSLHILWCHPGFLLLLFLCSFLVLLLSNITYLKCMQSLEWKFGDTHICEPNMNKRAKPYLMGEHFFGLEIGLANFLRWVFGRFLVLLLQNILFLKCLRNMGVKITQTNICEPNMSFRAKNLNTEMTPVFKYLAKTECLYYIQYYCEII